VVAAQGDDAAVGRVLEEPGQEDVGLAELVDGLEQRDEPDPRDPGLEVDEARLAGEQDTSRR
jgi:hypothetical protein